MLEYKVGEKAVYPAQGVVEIMGIEHKEIGGKLVGFYVLRAVNSEMRILVPTDKARQVGLRNVASNGDVEDVLDILREREVHLDKQTWNRRYRGFMDKIKTGSLFEVAEVFRDLHRLKTQKTLSFGERRMLDTARTLIVKELAAARNWTDQRVEREIDRAFSS